jgi:hypothetical protein
MPFGKVRAGPFGHTSFIQGAIGLTAAGAAPAVIDGSLAGGAALVVADGSPVAGAALVVTDGSPAAGAALVVTDGSPAAGAALVVTDGSPVGGKTQIVGGTLGGIPSRGALFGQISAVGRPIGCGTPTNAKRPRAAQAASRNRTTARHCGFT